MARPRVSQATVRTSLVLVLVACAGLLSLPAAGAQAEPAAGPPGIISFGAVETSNDTVTPVTGITTLTIPVEIVCQWPTPAEHVATLNPSTDNAVAVMAVLKQTEIRYTVPPECVPGTRMTLTPVTITVTADRTARAHDTVTVTLTAVQPETEDVTINKELTIDLYPNVQAHFAAQIFKVAPGSPIMIPMSVNNQGNGALAVDIAAPPGDIDAFDATLPGPFIVSDASDERHIHHVPIDLVAPGRTGYMNERYNIQVTLQFMDAFDGSQAADPMQLTAVIQVQGTSFAGETPSHPMLLGPLVLAAFAALLRRQGPDRAEPA